MRVYGKGKKDIIESLEESQNVTDIIEMFSPMISIIPLQADTVSPYTISTSFNTISNANSKNDKVLLNGQLFQTFGLPNASSYIRILNNKKNKNLSPYILQEQIVDNITNLVNPFFYQKCYMMKSNFNKKPMYHQENKSLIPNTTIEQILHFAHEDFHFIDHDKFKNEDVIDVYSWENLSSVEDDFERMFESFKEKIKIVFQNKKMENERTDSVCFYNQDLLPMDDVCLSYWTALYIRYFLSDKFLKSLDNFKETNHYLQGIKDYFIKRQDYILCCLDMKIVNSFVTSHFPYEGRVVEKNSRYDLAGNILKDQHRAISEDIANQKQAFDCLFEKLDRIKEDPHIASLLKLQYCLKKIPNNDMSLSINTKKLRETIQKNHKTLDADSVMSFRLRENLAKTMTQEDIDILFINAQKHIIHMMSWGKSIFPPTLEDLNIFWDKISQYPVLNRTLTGYIVTENNQYMNIIPEREEKTLPEKMLAVEASYLLSSVSSLQFLSEDRPNDAFYPIQDNVILDEIGLTARRNYNLLQGNLYWKKPFSIVRENKNLKIPVDFLSGRLKWFKQYNETHDDVIIPNLVECIIMSYEKNNLRHFPQKSFRDWLLENQAIVNDMSFTKKDPYNRLWASSSETKGEFEVLKKMPENFKLLDPCLQLALRHQLLEENLKILSMKKIISPSVFQKYIDIVKPNLDFFKIDDPNDWKNLEAKNMLQKIETDFQESPKKGRKP